MFRSPRRQAVLILAFLSLLSLEWLRHPDIGRAQQAAPVGGGQGFLFLSQFANPGLLGSLYLTPTYPITGFYPLYPGAYSLILPEDTGIRAGAFRLHPSMGIAEIYTDNVFRTNTNRTSDFAHTLSPGFQAQLPLLGRHLFVVDYRTNLQFYEREPSNDVRDQTASGRMKFNFPSGFKVDLQGEYKLGHDPRGSAVDTQQLEVNKWETESMTADIGYAGAQAGISLNSQLINWHFLNNNQALIRDRLSNYTGVLVYSKVGKKTSALLNGGVYQEFYDQNKNLDSTVYLISGGARWDVTAVTSGEILIGYQFLRFNRARVDQSGPVLGLFTRDRDSFSNFFISGNMNWRPTSRLNFVLQPYRTIEQTVVAGTLFFVATGANLSGTYDLTNRIALTTNLGYEQDKFSGSPGLVGSDALRKDLLSNVAIGLNYQAVKWFGVGLQYMFEHRDSNIDTFSYRANTFMVSVQAVL